MIWTSHPRALEHAQRAFESRGSKHRGQDVTAVLVAAGAVLAALSMWAMVAHGETAPEAPRRATLEHEGTVGLWFREDVARAMLADLEELPLLRARVSLLEERLTLRDGQVSRLRTLVDLAQEGERIAMDGLEDAVRSRTAAEASASAWWRSPVLWLAVGVVVTAGLVALTAYALSAVSLT